MSFQPGAVLGSWSARDANAKKAKQLDAKQRAAEVAALAYANSYEGRSEARAAAAIRLRRAEDWAAEKAAREAQAVVTRRDAEIRAEAVAGLGGAATPELIDLYVAEVRKIEARGQTLEESYRWRDPRTGQRPE